MKYTLAEAKSPRTKNIESSQAVIKKRPSPSAGSVNTAPKKNFLDKFRT